MAASRATTSRPTPSTYVLHEGFIGVHRRGSLHRKQATQPIEKESESQPATATGGWLGITDKYWAATIIPPQTAPSMPRFSHFTDGQPRFQADYKAERRHDRPRPVDSSCKNLVFAGAKEVRRPRRLREDLFDFRQFDRLIDWGWF